LEQNNSDITGVLYQEKAKLNYDLRRYFPDAEIADLVEQFWLVDWRLENGKEHIQQNLPDPNFHLVFENGRAKLIGPVSKVYSYKMTAEGQIFAVKFKAGALAELLTEPMTHFVDQEREAAEYFGAEVNELASVLQKPASDGEVVDKIHAFLTPFVRKATTQRQAVEQQLSLIKQNAEITKVEQLAKHANTSVRTLQRNFIKYFGLTPKWLIRKYRLHQALTKLESEEVDIAEVVESLGYTDQPHLIRDFKEILGVTPNYYSTNF